MEYSIGGGWASNHRQDYLNRCSFLPDNEHLIMSPTQTQHPPSGSGGIRSDSKVRLAVQIFQFFLLVMLAMQVFVQKRKGDLAVKAEQQKAYQTESVLRREIYDLKSELAKAQERVKELEKAAAR